MATPKPMLPKVKERLIYMMAQGCTVKMLADAEDVTSSTMYQRLKRANIVQHAPRKQQRDWLPEKKLIREMLQTKTVAEVGKHYGVEPRTMQTILGRLKISARAERHYAALLALRPVA
jgi:transposase